MSISDDVIFRLANAPSRKPVANDVVRKGWFPLACVTSVEPGFVPFLPVLDVFHLTFYHAFGDFFDARGLSHFNSDCDIWIAACQYRTFRPLFLLAAALALGLLTVWAQGDSIFGRFSLPMLRSGQPGFGHQMQSIHGTLVNLILILAPCMPLRRLAIG